MQNAIFYPQSQQHCPSVSRKKCKMLSVVVSDTDWGISTPFGNVIQAIQGESPLPVRTKYMKNMTLAGQMNGVISFHFIPSFPNFSKHLSSTHIRVVKALNL